MCVCVCGGGSSCKLKLPMIQKKVAGNIVTLMEQDSKEACLTAIHWFGHLQAGVSTCTRQTKAMPPCQWIVSTLCFTTQNCPNIAPHRPTSHPTTILATIFGQSHYNTRGNIVAVRLYTV